MDLRETLRQMRSEIGLTQSELADAVHVSFTAVSRWENKNIRPNKASSVALIELAKEKHVSSICFDNMNRILFASRADDKKDRLLTAQVLDTMKIEQRELMTSEQLKTTIDNIDVGVIAQRVFSSSSDHIELMYYNRRFAEIFGYSQGEFAKMCKANPYFAIERNSRSLYIRKLKMLLSGKITLESFKIELKAFRKDGTMFWLEVKAISLRKYTYGQELFTICRDVTERMEAQIKYKEEVAYRDISLSGCFARLHCDLTANTVLRQGNKYAITGSMFSGETADEILQEVSGSSLGVSERADFCEKVNRKALLRAHSKNIFSGYVNMFSISAARWLKVEYHTVKNPESNHVEVLIYFYDNQKGIIAQRVLEIISEYFFDLIGFIDIASGRIGIYYSNTGKMTENPEFVLYESFCKEQLRNLTEPESIDSELNAIRLETIVKHLESKKFMSHVYSLKGDCGSYLLKTTYTYADDGHRQILVAQSNINSIQELAKKL